MIHRIKNEEIAVKIKEYNLLEIITKMNDELERDKINAHLKRQLTNGCANILMMSYDAINKEYTIINLI